MHFRHSILPAALLACAALVAQDSQLENDQVRVVIAHDQPHKKTALHEHKSNRVMVYLTPGKQEIKYQDGRDVKLNFKAGDVKWSEAGGMHVSELTSDQPVTIVEVEVKKPWDASKTISTPLDPPKVDPKDYKVEFENPQVRVVRVHMAAHHSVPLHEHVLNRVVIYLTPQNTRMTQADGKLDVSQHKPGEVSWGVPVKHREENLNDSPFEAVVVELKN